MPVKRNLDEGIVIGEETERVSQEEYRNWVELYGKEEADKLAAMTQEDWDNVELPQEVLDVLNQMDDSDFIVEEE